MANLYVINGNGGIVYANDNTKYSLTSGGEPAGVLPTQYDNIILDENSGGVLGSSFTYKLSANAVCNSFNAKNPHSGVLTLDSNIVTGTTHYMITLYGSIKIEEGVVNLIKGSQTSGWVFRGTGNQTIDIRVPFASFTMYNAGTWDLLHDIEFNDDLSPTFLISSAITLNTNGFNITNGGFQQGTYASTLNFGTSTITLSREVLIQSPTVTINGENSAISCRGRFYGSTTGGFGTGWGEVLQEPQTSVTTAPVIQCILPIKKFTIKCRHYGNANTGVQLIGNITAQEELNLLGDAVNSRLFLCSSSKGIQRTITCNGVVNAQNVDLEDINAQGTADWNLENIIGGSGDCGGNSNITFSPEQTVYLRTNSSSNYYSNIALWFKDPEFTQPLGRPPLTQENVKITMQSFPSAGRLLYFDRNRLGKDIDFSEVANSPTSITNCECGWYGSFTHGVAMTFSQSQMMYCYGRGNHTIRCNGKWFGYTVNVYAPNGTYTLLDTFKTNGGFIGVRQGTFISDGKTLDLLNISISSRVGDTSIPLMTNLANSLVILRGGSNVLSYAPNSPQSTMDFTNTIFELVNSTACSFNCGTNLVYGNLRIKSSNTVTFAYTGGVTFDKVHFQPNGNIQITFPNTIPFKYNEITGGGHPRALVTLQNTSGISTARLDKQTPGEVVLNYVVFRYIQSLDVDTIYAVNSYNIIGNVNIIFGQSPTLLARNKKADLLKLL